jgi:hypothetical protein
MESDLPVVFGLKHCAWELRFHKTFCNSGVARPGFFGLHFDHQTEAFAKTVFQMLHGPETLKMAVDHDGQSRAKRFALLEAYQLNIKQ